MVNCSPVVGTRRVRPALAVVTAALTVGLLLLPACSSSAEAATFQREAVSARTADPFTPSVGTDQTGLTAPPNVKAAAYSATIPGLYGGSGETAVCDPAKLIQYLGANPDKARAWAGVLGIAPGDIGTYIAKLTPVVLRTDTAVTNHGFQNGAATSVPAVLQAGTAVLIDSRGVPVVKCGCGNPLTAAPSTKNAKFTGTSWTGFTPSVITTVKPAPAALTAVVVATPSGDGVIRPTGTTGSEDSPYDPSTPIETVEDPSATTPGAADGTTAAVDPGSPAADTPTADDASPAENPDAAGTTPTEPAGPGVSLTGTSTPGPECAAAGVGVDSGPVTVTVNGTGDHRTVTLPSASLPGFDGLHFAVNPDGSIDSEVTYNPPGAAGLTVTYRFQGQLSENDPPTPWTVTGTLTTTGAGFTCSVRYDASGQAAPTPSTNTTTPSDHTTTYVATYWMAGSEDAPGGTVGHDCAIAGFLDYPFAVTIRARDVGSRTRVTVVGDGRGSGSGEITHPLPPDDLTTAASTSGAFSVGGTRTYSDEYQGDFTARWSGDVGGTRTRPESFRLRMYQNWERDRDFIHWLNGSGGPEDYSCTYDVTAVRQG